MSHKKSKLDPSKGKLKALEANVSLLTKALAAETALIKTNQTKGNHMSETLNKTSSGPSESSSQ